MALGSLIDAGADLKEIRLLLDRLSLPGWELHTEETLRGGVACTRALVQGRDDGTVRTHAAIAELITGAALPPRVTERALAVFRRLADVESALHRVPVDRVHFHEVGGHDAIIDIVGTVVALEVLAIDEVTASPVATGTGMVRSAHGPLPNPSPAAVRLLEGVPTYGRATTVELTTPTGAALLAALSTSFGPMPAMVIHHSGFGAGKNEMEELPNCTQVVIGQYDDRPSIGSGQPALVLETNLDDVTGEQLGYAVSAALEAGAFDAWVSPVIMKKGRPGHVLHVLTDAARLDGLRHVMQTTTGTFGVRATVAGRWPAARSFDEVSVDGMPVRMKVGSGRAKPEFEDVALIASATGAAVREVASRAEAEWRRRYGNRSRPMTSHGMFDYDEDMTDLVMAYCKERLALNPVPLDFGGQAPGLGSVLTGLMRPEGNDAADVLQLFVDRLATAVVSCDSPRFLSFIPAAPTKAALLFDMFVSCSSLHGTSWLEAAGAVVAENQALDVIARTAGLPPGAGGCFVAGGSAGNLSALVVARDTAGYRRGGPGPSRPLIAISDEAHSSVAKALHVIGVEALVIPTDDHRLTGTGLRNVLARHPRADDVVAVVATAGTTNAGIIDDLSGVAEVATERNVWFHIDGAYGGAALFAPSSRHKFAGFEKADSFIVDPHKWLFAPFDCAALLYRQPNLAKAVHTQDASYLEVLHSDNPEEWNPSDYAYHLTRRARGLPIWFSMAVYGTRCVQRGGGSRPVDRQAGCGDD